MRTNHQNAKPIVKLHAIFTMLVSVVVLLIPTVSTAQSYTFETLYTFVGGADGGPATAGLIQDASGNLYGVAHGDGINNNHGVIFKISPTGEYSVLHTFSGSPDGTDPGARLVMDTTGNLYGTAGGGANGFGTVFKLTPSGQENVLYSFLGGADGVGPQGDLIMDTAGNFYGTTVEGGGTACSSFGCGTVFKLSPDGSETVLHSFTDTPDGANPQSGLVMDANGNLYGTTFFGGTYNAGTVYKVSPTGAEVVLYSFKGKDGDGKYPLAKLYIDKAGNLFGTTLEGGRTAQCTGCGTIFELFANGKEVILHAFNNQTDGAQPSGELVRDKVGNFYGTTVAGVHAGVVYELSPNGTLTVLQTFPNGSARDPYDGLLLDASGNLYGTLVAGGAHKLGVVFELKH